MFSVFKVQIRQCPVKSQDDINKATPLECPKCSESIGNELVIPYYAVTDNLKNLLDGNRWMPLLVKDSLVKAGVGADHIYTEVKHGEDEIDVLAFFQDRVLVIEAKDRPASLNDAYKLSAKTSRLENIISKNIPGRRIAKPIRDVFHYELEHPKWIFVPVIISTKDIAKDAKDLLSDTRDSAKYLENCEGKIDKFISHLIEEINQEVLRLRFLELTSSGSDSLARLTGELVSHAFNALFIGKDTSVNEIIEL